MLAKLAWLLLVGCVMVVMYRVVWPEEVTRVRRSCSGEADAVSRQGCVDRAMKQPNAAPALQ
jgi:hypothetical protein